MQKSIYTPEQQHLQNLLRQIRIEADLTQVELAEKLDTPHSRISDYERGIRRLDLIQLYRVCAAVGLPFRDFIDRFLEGMPEGH